MLLNHRNEFLFTEVAAIVKACNNKVWLSGLIFGLPAPTSQLFKIGYFAKLGLIVMHPFSHRDSRIGRNT
jgi:hypothetical protein